MSDSTYDVIIIGAGLAGLVSGAILAKEGTKVLVLEQHHTVGGCATNFKRKQYEFEVGLHEMDGLGNEHDPKHELFEKLEIPKHITFKRVPEFYRVKWNDVDFIMPDDIDLAIIKLQKTFPKEERNIEDFFAEMRQIRSFKTKSLFNRRKATLGEVLDEYFTSEELKIILCSNLAYYHDAPYELSFIYFAIAQLSYLEGGGWYIAGKSLTLSKYLADYIENHGGKIILKHEVTEILLDEKQKKVKGVKYIRTKRKDPSIESAFANIIIANTAVTNIAEKLIPSLKNSSYKNQIDQQDLPCSLLSIYMAFTNHDFENSNYSTFIFDDSLRKLQDFSEIERGGDYNQKGFVFVDYSVLGEPLTGTICAVDYMRNWDELTKEDYKEKKKKVMEIFINRLEKQFSGIKKSIAYAEMATPKTITKYTKNPSGVVYGFTETPSMLGKRRLEVATPPIANLYIASAWGSTGGGYSGAMLAGYKTASMLLKKKLRK